MYQGHMPIGYNLEPTTIPRNTFFIVALRELVAQKVSLYDYKASFPGRGPGPARRGPRRPNACFDELPKIHRFSVEIVSIQF